MRRLALFKKATNIVVVGAKGSDTWKTGHYGGKIEKAIKLQDKGEIVMIYEENDFIPVIQKIIENGNECFDDKGRILE